MRKRAGILAVLAALLMVAAACSETAGTTTEDAEGYPSEELDWTIAFGPGGGNDIMARTMVDILKREKLYPANIAVENRDGGSGALGWGHVFKEKGNPYVISTTSGSFITTPLESDTGWTYEDFTPVGLFATDATLFVVSKKSGITSWEQWVDFAKQKGGKVAVGGIGTVNIDFIHHDMLAEHEGYEINYTPFNEEGQLLTALTSGSLDAIVSNPGEVLGQIESGDMVPLLFTGPEPLPALPDVPTGKSIGTKELPTTPRGLILPPDTPAYAQQWWISTMKKVAKTAAWQKYLEDNYLVADVRWGKDFGAYLSDTSGDLERILKERGAI
jgi:putative tricarboxylic transport membrane protein